LPRLRFKAVLVSDEINPDSKSHTRRLIAAWNERQATRGQEYQAVNHHQISGAVSRLASHSLQKVRTKSLAR
jgi:hypothetical protein